MAMNTPIDASWDVSSPPACRHHPTQEIEIALMAVPGGRTEPGSHATVRASQVAPSRHPPASKRCHTADHIVIIAGGRQNPSRKSDMQRPSRYRRGKKSCPVAWACLARQRYSFDTMIRAWMQISSKMRERRMFGEFLLMMREIVGADDCRRWTITRALLLLWRAELTGRTFVSGCWRTIAGARASSRLAAYQFGRTSSAAAAAPVA